MPATKKPAQQQHIRRQSMLVDEITSIWLRAILHGLSRKELQYTYVRIDF